MPDTESEYEKSVRKTFWLTPVIGVLSAYLRWRDQHRAALLRLLADPRIGPEAAQAIRETL